MTSTPLRMLALIALLGLAPAAWAVQPDEMLKDPHLETRARTISAELRCLVCQNQSIDDSDAPLARDLRLLVRERIQAGDSDSQVLRFLVDRYGDFILLRPPFDAKTYALWLAPLLIFIVGVLLARRLFRAPEQPIPARAPDLTVQEQQRLRELLDGDTAQPKS
jgi:cytochrome c-type biogenesis protein CcmH